MVNCLPTEMPLNDLPHTWQSISECSDSLALVLLPALRSSFRPLTDVPGDRDLLGEAGTSVLTLLESSGCVTATLCFDLSVLGCETDALSPFLDPAALLTASPLS